jgi:hypothetical protein
MLTALRLSGKTHVFKLTVTGPREMTTGYLAVSRAGKVVSVLRRLSAPSTPDGPAGTAAGAWPTGSPRP